MRPTYISTFLLLSLLSAACIEPPTGSAKPPADMALPADMAAADMLAPPGLPDMGTPLDMAEPLDMADASMPDMSKPCAGEDQECVLELCGQTICQDGVPTPCECETSYRLFLLRPDALPVDLTADPAGAPVTILPWEEVSLQVQECEAVMEPNAAISCTPVDCNDSFPRLDGESVVKFKDITALGIERPLTVQGSGEAGFRGECERNGDIETVRKGLLRVAPASEWFSNESEPISPYTWWRADREDLFADMGNTGPVGDNGEIGSIRDASSQKYWLAIREVADRTLDLLTLSGTLSGTKVISSLMSGHRGVRLAAQDEQSLDAKRLTFVMVMRYQGAETSSASKGNVLNATDFSTSDIDILTYSFGYPLANMIRDNGDLIYPDVLPCDGCNVSAKSWFIISKFDTVSHQAKLWGVGFSEPEKYILSANKTGFRLVAVRLDGDVGSMSMHVDGLMNDKEESWETQAASSSGSGIALKKFNMFGPDAATLPDLSIEEIFLGNGVHPRKSFDGQIAEMFVYQSYLTDEQLTDLSTYLAKKYNLTVQGVDVN